MPAVKAVSAVATVTRLLMKAASTLKVWVLEILVIVV
jgi:hypothetical protein